MVDEYAPRSRRQRYRKLRSRTLHQLTARLSVYKLHVKRTGTAIEKLKKKLAKKSKTAHKRTK